MSDRLTNIRTGKGDCGFSNLISGLRIKKSSSICFFQNQIQLVSNTLRSVNFKDFPEEDVEIIREIITSTLNNISASCYFNFENKDYNIKVKLQRSIEKRIEQLSETLGSFQEFIIFEDEEVLKLERSMIEVRQAEHLFWVVLEEVCFCRVKSEKTRDSVINSLASFLNSLSDYLFLLSKLKSNKDSFWQKEVNNKGDEK